MAKSLSIFACVVCAALAIGTPSIATPININFDEFTSPPVTGQYADTGIGPTLVYPQVTVNGGLVMNNTGWNNEATSGSNLYGTTDVYPSGIPFTGGSITLTFDSLVRNLSLDLINGLGAADFTLTGYDASLNVLGSDTVFLTSFTNPGSIGSLSLNLGGIAFVEVTTDQPVGGIDFAIDTIVFDVPEPATLFLFGAGLMCLGAFRCYRKVNA